MSQDRQHRLWAVAVESHRECEVYVVAATAEEAAKAVEDDFEQEWFGLADDDLEVGSAREVAETTAAALEEVRQRDWAGPPVLAPGVPGRFAVDMGPLLADELQAPGEPPEPGSRAYQDAIEAAGQLRLLEAGRRDP